MQSVSHIASHFLWEIGDGGMRKRFQKVTPRNQEVNFPRAGDVPTRADNGRSGWRYIRKPSCMLSKPEEARLFWGNGTTGGDDDRVEFAILAINGEHPLGFNQIRPQTQQNGSQELLSHEAKSTSESSSGNTSNHDADWLRKI